MAYAFDVLSIGSGIAGLSFALKMAQRGFSVGIITKKNRAASSTNWAQGGIAAVTSQTDDVELHVADTLRAGDGLCDEAVVREIVRRGPPRIQELAEMGVPFSRLDDGRISLGKEGGHSKRRILHVKDVTGRAIEEALLKAIASHPKIQVFEHFLAIDLIMRSKVRRAGLPVPTSENRVLGVYALDIHGRKVHTIQARAIMLATGGVGQVYQFTTNPDIATGDGIAMAFRAGCEVRNMEFIQFHPTALYSPMSDRFLISEAVRGEGAVLRNAANEAFMRRYDERADLAPRDIVARAIDSEMKRSGERHVWLDVSPIEDFGARFPNIHAGCLAIGIDATRERIPVVPAAHYLCGGVVTNLRAETSLPGLYACGEVACTGLHGANRLASNSLLEAVVLADSGADAVEEFLQANGVETHEIPDWEEGDLQDPDERVVLAHNWDELRRTLWDYVSIVRTTKRLERARTRILTLEKEVHEYYWNFRVEPMLLELRNLIQVAALIVDCALQRKESRGLHYTLDYPNKQDDPIDSAVHKRRM